MDRALNVHSKERSASREQALHLFNHHLQKEQPDRMTGLTGELQLLLILKVKPNPVEVQLEDGDFHLHCTVSPVH